MTAEAKPIPQMDAVTSPDGDHALLRAYARQAPIVRTPLGTYLAFRQQDAERIINDEASRQIELEFVTLRGITDGPILDLFQNGMLTANGEVHRRRRSPAAKTFAFKLMDGMRGAVREHAAALVAKYKSEGPIDFLHDFAGQIPARMIARILGAPEADLPRFSGWVEDTAKALSFFPIEIRPRIEASLVAFNAYVAELLDSRRANPREDFLTEYARTTAEDGELSEAEIRTQIMGLILAGSETTRTSICATLSQLLQHPDQWRAFCADPEGLKKGVVNEGLRFNPAVGSLARLLNQDLDIDGYVVPKGSLVSLSLLGMLRDPEIYANPDTFNIMRTDHPRWHLVFGAGAHRCLGEALARAELEETLAVIARDAPNTTLVGAPPKLEGLAGIRRIDRMQAALA